MTPTWIVRIVVLGFLLVWAGCTASEPSGRSETDVASGGSVRLHGVNLVGMEGTYTFDAEEGPVPDVDYAVHSTAIIDYLAEKNVNVLRFLFSWERMQSVLNGDIPAAQGGYYKAYFDDYMRIVDYATNVKSMTVIATPWQTTSAGGAAGGPRWRGALVGDAPDADGQRVTNANFIDFWSRMATLLRDRPRVAIGLVTEPNQVDTMRWFALAQDTISAVRAAGFSGDIYVPGNGWTAAGSWDESWYDTGSPQRSNAYGWLNARGVGEPLADPLEKLVVEVHTYADADAAGSSATVVSKTISRKRIHGLVKWARANHLKVFVGEVGMYADAPNASENWTDFVRYLTSNADTVIGFAWWACGKPGWWDDVAATNGGHFALTPTNGYEVDTVNMSLFSLGAPTVDAGEDLGDPEVDGGAPDIGDGDGAESEEEPDAGLDDEGAASATGEGDPSGPEIADQGGSGSLDRRQDEGARTRSSSAKQTHPTRPSASTTPAEDAEVTESLGCSVTQRPQATPPGLVLAGVALVAAIGARRRGRSVVVRPGT